MKNKKNKTKQTNMSNKNKTATDWSSITPTGTSIYTNNNNKMNIPKIIASKSK